MSSSDINLSAAIRTNLISLQGTQASINTTQNDLSTGLVVNNAIDNPVAYFQGQALSDRASDFSEKKSNIDQGISSLSTALEGINGVESLVNQLQGLALNAESSTSGQIGGLVQQFNSLRGQINTLAADASYQGLDLIAGTGSKLSVSFSTSTAASLTVQSVDVTSGPKGLNIAQAVTANGGFAVDFTSNTGISLTNLSAQTFLYAGTAASLTAGVYTFNYGSATLSVSVVSAGSVSGSFTTTSQFVDGQAITLQFLGTGAVGQSVQNGNTIAVEYGSGSTIVSTAAIGGSGGSGSTIVVDFNALTGATLNSGNYTFSYGGQTVSFTVYSGGATSGTFTNTQTFVNGGPITLTVGSVGITSATNYVSVVNPLGNNVNNNEYAVTNLSTNGIVNSGGTFTFEFQGLTGIGLNSGSYTFLYGGQTLSFAVASAGNTGTATFTTTQTFVNGQDITVTLGSAAGTGTAAGLIGFGTGGGLASATLGGSRQNGYDFVVEYAAASSVVLASGNAIVVDLNGLTGSSLGSGTYTFNYGGQVLSFVVGSAAASSGTFSSTATLTNGALLTLTLASAGTVGTAGNFITGLTTAQDTTITLPAQTIGVSVNNLSGYTIVTNGQSIYTNTAGNLGVTVSDHSLTQVAQVTGQFTLDASLPNGINSLINSLASALTTLRSQAQTVGSNVALLNTRLDFTNNYINLLTAGAGKLTLADLNQEGANLLSLQTSQQLGIQALAFAGQNEKSVLSLFR
jgi:flagellin-like hook-associated protein FlgL